MELADLIQSKRNEILEIAGRYGARQVYVFGSVARNEMHPGSDIDFLVEMESGRSLFDLGGMLYDLRELLGVDVDVVTPKGLRPRIKDEVIREAIPL